MKENKIKTFEMFAGYGGASFALKKAGIDFECVGYSEIDKYAVQCYEQNHLYKKSVNGRYENTLHCKNYGDATLIDPHEIPDFDLLTGGFPCQAFSVAGKGLGELDTRGTLFNDIIRIAEVKQPKYMLLENVKGLTNKRHKETFEKILSELNRIGYYVKWKVLNTKEYGIPQNRERVFFVCFKSPIAKWDFEFPEKEELKIFLKDILEDNVENKYFLKPERVQKLLLNINPLKGKNNIHGCITEAIGRSGSSSEFKQSLKKVNESIIKINSPNHSSQRVYSSEGISPTISAGNRGGGKEPCKILQIKNATKKGYLEAYAGDGINLEQPNSKTRRGRVQPQTTATLQCDDARGVVIDISQMRREGKLRLYDGISSTLDTMQGGWRQPCILDDTQGFDGVRTYKECPTIRAGRSGLKVDTGLTIRKLTPTECFRLMGFLDDSINLEGLSNTQRYKLAGNGWDINLVSKIFKRMFRGE